MRRIHFLVKLDCITLTLMVESIRILIKCWPNENVYWIHNTYYNLTVELFEITPEFASILVAITDAKVTQTNTSF